jgi:hypothetical protein
MLHGVASKLGVVADGVRKHISLRRASWDAFEAE